jgi:hypothetical protein
MRRGHRHGRLGDMTTPDGAAPQPAEAPQPRDIALEQATPEMEADLDAQSEPDSAETSGGS